MTEIFAAQGIPNVVHADWDMSMTSKTAATLLVDLEVTRSHSRPRGYPTTIRILQSLFKTLMYGPMWPEHFASIHHARNVLDAFTSWHNHEHRHTGIGLHSPADVHFGLAGQKATERAVVLA
jgi:transposase InsO family protein